MARVLFLVCDMEDKQKVQVMPGFQCEARYKMADSIGFMHEGLLFPLKNKHKCGLG